MGLVGAVVGVLALLVGCTTVDDAPVAGLVPGRVLARPWPERVTPTGPWTATLRGTGPLLTLTSMPGAIPGGLAHASFELGPPTSAVTAPTSAVPPTTVPSGLNLTLPDGARWYPSGRFQIESTADLPFVSLAARAQQAQVSVGSLEAALSGAGDSVTAIGRFSAPDGRMVDRLVLPKGTAVGEDCGHEPPCPVPVNPPVVTVDVPRGTIIPAATGAERGEAAVGGEARIEALDHTWDGVVAAIEGSDLSATAVFGIDGWTLESRAGNALQAWVDVWPVADTVLVGSSGVDGGSHNCLRDCTVRVRWRNEGWASSQVLEAEGVGPGGPTVGFDLNKTLGHDAGLGVRRGDQKVNLGGGGDIDSNLAPGEKVDRGVSHTPGVDVTLVLRGNFPDLPIDLDIP
jgi:hypothetical protein